LYTAQRDATVTTIPYTVITTDINEIKFFNDRLDQALSYFSG
jgi:hypothetical protein